MDRLGFGAAAGDRSAVADRAATLRWLETQLAAPAGDDGAAAQRIADTKLRIKYAANPEQGIEAVDEMRPLTTLAQPIDTTWKLLEGGPKVANQERVRPRFEVAAAALLRAVYSPWQLRERMVEFWHDHFNVYALDGAVAVALPAYDRDAIRPHALGNFRRLLEAVATSTAMLVYLNNRTSRAGSANENFARELFELHTLGQEHYFNAVYDRWRNVPGAADGKPIGYIDQDVYEAARAFTGWTVEDGTNVANGRKLPASGRFVYVEAFHDSYQKRVLAREFDPFRGPMQDGRDVLDMVATHPGTARFVAGKLAAKLVADRPSPRLVAAAAETFLRQQDAPDQIAQTIRTIVKHPEFAGSYGKKTKRPFDLVAGFVRGLGGDFQVTDSLLGALDSSGQKLFGWSPPTGHPDHGTYWLGTGAMRQRWQLVLGIIDNAWGTGKVDPALLLTGARTAGETVGLWQQRLTGARSPATEAAILQSMHLAADDAAPRDARLRRLVAYAGMSPEFQLR